MEAGEADRTEIRYNGTSPRQQVLRQCFSGIPKKLKRFLNRMIRMLAEYDFSKGERGKHRDRHLAPQLPGIKFLKNARGQKTAVLVDLTVHQELWQQAIACHPDQSDFQYLTDTESHTQSVFLDFKTNLSLWQTIYDLIIA